MKIYEGYRSPYGCAVSVREVDDAGKPIRRGRPLESRLDLRSHSPDGFEWGYGGSGPSQLALALCADALGDDARALAIYQHFKWAHVAKWPKDDWSTTDVQVKIDVEALEGMAARQDSYEERNDALNRLSGPGIRKL